MNTQSKVSIPLPLQKLLNSVTEVIWKSAFSTEFKNAGITINGALDVQK
jgi:hypothetical protein